MSNDNKELREAIKNEVDSLICESHPQVCALRGSNPDACYNKIEEIIMSSATPNSIQTAIAELEVALGEI